MLTFHRKYLPSFGLLAEDQAPVCKYTVLSINEKVRDCAAYEGVGPDLSRASSDERDSMMERIRAGGTKISEAAARALFDEIETMGLHYRR